MFGYANGPQSKNDLKLQVQSLREYGCDSIYKDKFQNRQANRKGLRRMLKAAKQGHTIVVHRNDAIFASARKMIEILALLNKKCVHFVSLSDKLFNAHNDKTGFLLATFSFIDKIIANLDHECRAKIKHPRKRLR